MKKITQKQQKVLDIILNRLLWRKPTLSDIAKMSGVSGKKSVFRIIQQLKDKGFLQKDGTPVIKTKPLDTSGTKYIGNNDYKIFNLI